MKEIGRKVIIDFHGGIRESYLLSRLTLSGPWARNNRVLVLNCETHITVVPDRITRSVNISGQTHRDLPIRTRRTAPVPQIGQFSQMCPTHVHGRMLKRSLLRIPLVLLELAARLKWQRRKQEITMTLVADP
jgi:hypothetical protein